MSCRAERHGVKACGDEEDVLRIGCRDWGCPECGPARARRLVADGMAGNPTHLLTLTVNPKRYTSPAMRAQAQVRAWTEVRRRAAAEAKRDPAKKPEPAADEPEIGWPRDSDGRVPRLVTLIDGKLPYLRVFEATKLGEPHMHILARAVWIDQRWLSAVMDQLTGAPVVHVRRIDSRAEASAYVAKYCGKEPHRFPGTQRYRASPDWRQEPLPDAPVIDRSRPWSVHQGPAERYVDQLTQLGAVVVFREHRLTRLSWGRAPP